MITKQVYYENPDKTTLECKVLSVKNTDKGQEVILDQTIFFPQGGGQPSDTGFLGEAKVEKVKIIDGEIVHFVTGNLQEGDAVLARIDFDHRQKYVKIHSAGHLIHDLVASLNSSLQPLKGEHGDNAYLEYTGEFTELSKEELETKVNELAKTGLTVITKPVTYEEMVKECPIIQSNLPKDKALRMLKIGNFPGMPDGGLQVKKTDEIGFININELTVKDGKTLIKYSVGEKKTQEHPTVAPVISHTTKFTGKKRVFSGTRPTGRLHLGNYLGMVKGSLELQNRDDLDCIYCVVDLHGLTTPYNKETYRAGIREVVLDYLGAGLDPKKCHLLVQSDVKAEHLELAYYFGCIYQVARLEDLPTYKEKKAQHPDYVNMGLLYYPVLMAADILIYKSPLVPIGQDQEPHMEVTREIARKFNSTFGSTFPEPQSYKTSGQYVPSLLGQGKMSKSVEGSFINLTDDFETIKKKLAKAPTDAGKGEKFPSEGPAANIMQFVELFQGHDRAMQYRQMYKDPGIRYGDLKTELAEAIYKELQPIQERRAYYEAHPEEVDKILTEGGLYAKSIASETLKEVREKMGLVG